MASVDGTAPSVEHIRVRVLPDGRMTRADTAKYLGRAEKTLAMWSLEGKGPTPHKVGGRIFYYLADCDAFIRAGLTREREPGHIVVGRRRVDRARQPIEGVVSRSQVVDHDRHGRHLITVDHVVVDTRHGHRLR